ncbi:uncharacterized protein B0I36DRAFT_257304 [Microdochium trichocladiopsis]|uniref:NACHT domain-containing protein n=1 Tax=Microdochium trichocladiopsis TaxID=1682393 RepID=A0A9P8XQ94_9PEZI|nr:uncharacterized protein B0I36DRAFT_257304 [Microdochium trichocladiopsis]KAH7010885.1 hypothetical protein B0I36DRAFT_257304 [Microdochium trichocladiopsis]
MPNSSKTRSRLVIQRPAKVARIVAVHGLGAHPEYTWTCQAPANSTDPASVQRVHLLKDLLLPDFPAARILSFAHNSDWLINAPVKTAQEIGYMLLQQLKCHRSRHPRIPIIFIGHSFGGIIIKEALCQPGDDSQDIADDTCGIVFLGTPHQGSPVSVFGAAAAFLTGFLGSKNTLLLSLRNHRPQLADLEIRFRRRMNPIESRRQKTEIVSFCESMDTYLLGWLWIGPIVTPDSAQGYAAQIISIDTDHSGLNKCSRREDQLYTELKKVLDRLKPTSEPTLNANQRYVVANLKVAEGATFDSKTEEHEARCLDGTRTGVIQHIYEWANDREGKCIYWLQGQAGTGKSTISRTVAHEFAARERLGASFFFKRGEGDRGGASRFFTTVAAQLACRIPSMAEHMRNAIEADPSINEKLTREQFKKLLLEPLRGALDSQTPLRTMVVLIDALDECDQERHGRDVTNIIGLLPEAKQLLSVRLRFFVTSRPELPIRLGFKDISGSYEDLILHQIPQPDIEHDITAFLEHEFTEIRKCYNKSVTPNRQLPPHWPGAGTVQKLVDMAIPLFIVAATVCRFIQNRNIGGPKEQLAKILEYQASRKSNLDAIYLPVLKQLLVGLPESEKCQVTERFKQFIGSIVLLAHPLSTSSLARLLAVPLDAIEDQLDLLHSVLSIPSDSGMPVRLLHLSFRDFLVDPEKGKEQDKYPFWVDGRQAHERLATQCLQLLSTGDTLKRDICGLRLPGTRRSEVKQRIIDDGLPPEVQYACRYWTYHWKESKCRIRDGDLADHFLTDHLLHWLEALGLLGRVSESIGMVDDLLGLLDREKSSNIFAFLIDTRRVILNYCTVIDASPLQVYSSAIVFAPQRSVVRKRFRNQFPAWLSLPPQVDSDWGACTATLEGHSDWVSSVVFSHDATKLASASRDKTIKLWDVATGACKATATLYVGTYITHLAFGATGSSLSTSIGTFTLSSASPLASSPSPLLISATPTTVPSVSTPLPQFVDRRGVGLSKDRAWVTWNSHQVLWLPQSYRPGSSSVIESTLAIGCPSGRVIFVAISPGQDHCI